MGRSLHRVRAVAKYAQSNEFLCFSPTLSHTTEKGVLLPKRAYIVELLPWVPWYLFGDWVRTKSKPTPLGVIFHNTELQHLGYPLGRKSVPLCLDVDPDDQGAERACFMNETNGNIEKFRWDVRDFIVRAEIVTEFISSFLLVRSELTCDEMQAKASSQNYVLYNAYCRESVTDKSRYQLKHYYHNVSVSLTNKFAQGNTPQHNHIDY